MSGCLVGGRVRFLGCSGEEAVEVGSAVQRLREARVAMDMEAMRSLHSDSEHLRLIATDDSAVWELDYASFG